MIRCETGIVNSALIMHLLFSPDRSCKIPVILLMATSCSCKCAEDGKHQLAFHRLLHLTAAYFSHGEKNRSEVWEERRKRKHEAPWKSPRQKDKWSVCGYHIHMAA